MALLKSLGTYVFSHTNGTLKLRATLSNIRELEAATGVQFYDYLNNCESQSKLATLFFHMQVADEKNDELHSEDDIYDAFFGDFETFVSLEKQIAEATFVLCGLDYQKSIAALDAKAKPGPKQKKIV